MGINYFRDYLKVIHIQNAYYEKRLYLIIAIKDLNIYKIVK